MLDSTSVAHNVFVQGLVYRYDVTKADDGVGGEEGTFCLCTLWCVWHSLFTYLTRIPHSYCLVTRAIEALTRAGEYDKGMLSKAVAMFEDFLQYLNHVGLCTEEISTSGEALGNAVQGFTYVRSSFRERLFDPAPMTVMSPLYPLRSTCPEPWPSSRSKQ